jgi:putative membrane-bound dehydrogenase-like protein
MRRTCGVWAVWAWTLVSVGQVLGQTPPPTIQVALDGQTFTLPAGFTIVRAAGPPLIERPIVADLDEQGRLYVAEAAGAIERADIQAQKAPHRVVRLEDLDGDGRYDRARTFADQLPFPEGVMWLDGSVYVAAPPKIWKLTDTDGDGVADQRTVWFDGQTVTGCANDLHGPYLGPDGWVYWCKGAFARQTYTLSNGQPFTTRAAHIFRARPDATQIEPVMTGGMDNPVDTVFLPTGERIFSTTFLVQPAAGLRDGLIHAVYGGIYGKMHDPIYDPDHRWSGPELMPVLVHMGPAAPCGLHRYAAPWWGPAFRDNLFACQFNLRKVSRHVLSPAGATFRSEDSDFLVSDQTDFHPTDVLEDADGSLLVLNTGGWYKLCCPSSQLVKADVPGAIYRIQKLDATAPRDPRGEVLPMAGLPLDRLVGLLEDPRPVVRRRAVEALARRGDPAVAPLAARAVDPHLPAEGACEAIWTLCRIEGDAAQAAIRTALRHPQVAVQLVALHAIALRRDRQAAPLLGPLLASASPRVVRAAAEALGRIGEQTAVPELLSAVAKVDDDPVLMHSLIYALIEIGAAQPLRTALGDPSPAVQRAALIALDQGTTALRADDVLARLDAADASLRKAARWIAARHTQWEAPLAEYLQAQLAQVGKGAADPSLLKELLPPLAKGQAVQQLLATTATDAQAALAVRRLCLEAMAASGLKELPAAWLDALTATLNPTSNLAESAIAVVRNIPPAKAHAPRLAEALRKFADAPGPAEQRLAAMSVIPGGLKHPSPKQWELIRQAIGRQQPPAMRSAAAEVLSKSQLTKEQLLELTEQLPQVGPLELDRILSAFTQSGDDSVGLALVAALSQEEVRAALTVDAVKQRLTRYGPSVQAAAEKLYALIDADHAQQRQRLEATLAALPAGDIRRGQAIFNSTRVSCRNCHTIGYVGGKVGPDLTRIGQIRQARDLLESILFPSASFVRSYEPVLIRTLEGEVFSGNIKQDAPDEIVLTVAADKEVRIARDQIEAMLPGKVSVMPAGLDQQLSLQDLADLIEFLKNCR